MVRLFCCLIPVAALIACGCRSETPAPVPVDGPAQQQPVAPAGPSEAQQAAIQTITEAGGDVTLDAAGMAERIDLASDRVFADDAIVRAALEFPQLRGLRLAVSSAGAETLAELATLTALEELLLQDAPLDDAQLGRLLTALPNLKRLTLRRVQGVTDAALDAVVACERLEVLALIEMNQLTGAGLQQLQKAERIRSLDLRNCGGLALEDFKHLTALEGLVELKLGGATVNDGVADLIAELSKVKALAIEDAEISAAFFAKIAEDQATAQRLRSLSFARCFGVTDEALAPVVALLNLETLALRDIMVTGSFLTVWQQSDHSPTPLKTLIAVNAFFGDEAIAQLPQVAPGLVRLDLRGNLGVTEPSREVFKQLEHLKDLQLEGTGIAGETPDNP